MHFQKVLDVFKSIIMVENQSLASRFVLISSFKLVFYSACWSTYSEFLFIKDHSIAILQLAHSLWKKNA
jgi:hypothetical protein